MRIVQSFSGASYSFTFLINANLGIFLFMSKDYCVGTAAAT